jgi:hypothetical protein
LHANGLGVGSTLQGTATVDGWLYVDKGIGINTTSPEGALDIKSTTGALIPPRMTSAQIALIVNPPDGALVYDVDVSQLKIRKSGNWVVFGSAVPAIFTALIDQSELTAPSPALTHYFCKTVSFGSTFSTVPHVIISVQDTNASLYPFTGDRTHITYDTLSKDSVRVCGATSLTGSSSFTGKPQIYVMAIGE